MKFCPKVVCMVYVCCHHQFSNSTAVKFMANRMHSSDMRFIACGEIASIGLCVPSDLSEQFEARRSARFKKPTKKGEKFQINSHFYTYIRNMCFVDIFVNRIVHIFVFHSFCSSIILNSCFSLPMILFRNFTWLRFMT